LKLSYLTNSLHTINIIIEIHFIVNYFRRRKVFGLKIIRDPIQKLDSINYSDNKLNNKQVIKVNENEENDEKCLSGSYDSQIDANNIKTNSTKRKK